MSRVEIAGATHTGNVRKINEDAFAIHEDIGLAIIADGVGGAACGELASALTVDTIASYLRSSPAGDPETPVRDAVTAADQAVRQAAAERADCLGMKSTVVLVRWRGPRFWIGNVGDSRAYRFRYGVLTQISYDHTVSTELEERHGWSPELARTVAMGKGLTMAIGGSKKPWARLYNEIFEDGDIILLCTDGLYGPAGEETMSRILSSGEAADVMTEQLLQAGLLAGGPDNITIIVLRYSESD